MWQQYFILIGLISRLILRNIPTCNPYLEIVQQCISRNDGQRNIKVHHMYRLPYWCHTSKWLRISKYTPYFTILKTLVYWLLIQILIYFCHWIQFFIVFCWFRYFKLELFRTYIIYYESIYDDTSASHLLVNINNLFP